MRDCARPARGACTREARDTGADGGYVRTRPGLRTGPGASGELGGPDTRVPAPANRGPCGPCGPHGPRETPLSGVVDDGPRISARPSQSDLRGRGRRAAGGVGVSCGVRRRGCGHCRERGRIPALRERPHRGAAARHAGASADVREPSWREPSWQTCGSHGCGDARIWPGRWSQKRPLLQVQGQADGAYADGAQMVPAGEASSALNLP